MDSHAIITYLSEKEKEYSRLHSHQLLQCLHVKEYIEIETKKDELFQKKMEFISMSKSLRVAMVRDTGYRQLKRYFVDMIRMTDDDATYAADRYNEGSRIYDKFPQIMKNLSRCPELDIRNFSYSKVQKLHDMEFDKSWLYLFLILVVRNSYTVIQNVNWSFGIQWYKIFSSGIYKRILENSHLCIAWSK